MMTMTSRRIVHLACTALALGAVVACGAKKPATQPTTPPTPASFPGTAATTTTAPPAPPTTSRPLDNSAASSSGAASDPLITMSVDDINRSAALKPVFFTYDSVD